MNLRTVIRIYTLLTLCIVSCSFLLTAFFNKDSGLLFSILWGLLNVWLLAARLVNLKRPRDKSKEVCFWADMLLFLFFFTVFSRGVLGYMALENRAYLHSIAPITTLVGSIAVGAGAIVMGLKKQSSVHCLLGGMTMLLCSFLLYVDEFMAGVLFKGDLSIQYWPAAFVLHLLLMVFIWHDSASVAAKTWELESEPAR